MFGVERRVLFQMHFISLVKKLSAVYVPKCLHWVTIDGSTGLAFVSFNAELEKFDFVPTPSFGLVKLGYPNDTCALGVIEDKLSFVKCLSDGCVQIFVMDKYGVKESWVKKFSIEKKLFTSSDDMVHCHVELIKCS